MSKFLLIFCLANVVNGQFLEEQKALEIEYEDPEIEPEKVCNFEEYTEKHGKKYPDQNSKIYHENIFQENCREALRNNEKPDRKYKMAVSNQFSDMTNQQFKSKMLGTIPKPPKQGGHLIQLNTGRQNKKGQLRGHQRNLQSYKISINWVDRGKVTDIRNQGSCGSCWAFSISGSIESLYMIERGMDSSIHVSEQQQIDCVYQDRDGCQGGWLETGFNYITSTGGLTSNDEYPYRGISSWCRGYGGKFSISDFKEIHQFWFSSCEEVHQALMKGPVSAAVDATNWDRIGDEIIPYTYTFLYEINHGVIIVGFNAGSYNTEPYWLIKNSWGRYWGQNGYIKLSYGPDGNNLGVCRTVFWPELD